MALINIEYGSVARSEVLNKNFLYLDDKIAESNTSITTNISSILSNIATINSRLNDLAESVSDYVENFNSTLDEYKIKTKMLVNMASMVPNWSGYTAISDMSDFLVPSNGFLLLTPRNTSKGVLLINGVTIDLKLRSSADDNSSQTVAIPVKENDEVKSEVDLVYAFFVPTNEVSIEGF